jgi:hypothetical protein
VLCVEPRGRRADAGGRYAWGQAERACVYGRPRTGESARHGEERRKRDRRRGTYQHALQLAIYILPFLSLVPGRFLYELGGLPHT